MQRWTVPILVCGVVVAQQPLQELTPSQKSEAVRLMEGVRRDPRGPYGPIWWYCKDGQKLPPKGAPCGKQGGFQHAAPSAAAQRLSSLNYDLARFLSGMPFEEFFDLPRNHYWLRQLIMLDYLNARANGWIYAKTFTRRGVRQAEDEEKEGRRLLTAMLGRHDWVAANYLLAMQTVAAVPHGRQAGRTKEIRALSASLADALPSFQPLRGKIHSRPEPADVMAVEEFVRQKRPADTDGFSKLVALMKAEYAEDADIAGFNIEAQAKRSLELRIQLSSPGLRAAQRLEAADEQLKIQEEAFRYGTRPPHSVSRRVQFREIDHWLRLAAGGGWISVRQLKALQAEIELAMAAGEIQAGRYEKLVAYVEGGAEWARATTSLAIGEVESRYQIIEPLAAGLSDDLLRRSVMLPLAQRVEVLTRDANTLAGRRHQVPGAAAIRGIRALNPGVAVGRLEIIEQAGNHPAIEPDRIYAIPATVADLGPMKGILTLDSGNALSHAQLLAANLGIPNSTVPSSLLPELMKLRGQMMFYAVTPRGTIVLREWEGMSPAERSSWEEQKAQRVRIKLDTSKSNVQDRRLRQLEEISMADAGVLCGPKAANLGQLKRLFPDTVAPGVVVPFGVYYAHASRPDSTGVSVLGRVKRAQAEEARLRSGNVTPEARRNALRPQLEEIRRAIRSITLDPGFVTELQTRLRQTFGPDGTYGVFVRSDTNAEDLPQFTGAGLNLTLPNVVGEAKIVEGVKEVWASPFQERAWAWRSEALESSEGVYPSVVLLRTVPSSKSGVMATANLSTLDLTEITVNTSEGVAAVVDGGVAESLLLQADGKVRLLAQARAPYRKVALPKGGFAMEPTSGSDLVLTDTEIQRLRDLAREVKSKLQPARDEQGRELPWDIEFGFEEGALRLFQIRPLVRYREAKTLDALETLESGTGGERTVRLDRPVGEE